MAILAKMCYGSKINKDKLIKVTINQAELVRSGSRLEALERGKGASRVEESKEGAARRLCTPKKREGEKGPGHGVARGAA
jgi:hypothetical protein